MNRLIVIVGPTAVGKSALAMELAIKFNCEIISGDSMCVYRGMDIGTAKPSLSERAQVCHHLIDIRNPDEDFSVVDFQRLANAAIEQINLRGRIPILVGGTGLYVQALLEGYQFSPTAKKKPASAVLEQTGTETATVILHHRLALIDPDTALRIHPNDRKRILRAFEVAQAEQRPISRQKAHEIPTLEFDCIVVGLTVERQELYRRIESRVDRMIEAGLIGEVRDILNVVGPAKDVTALQAIGYKEIAAYLQGRSSLQEAVAQVKQSSRRYAKRQITWFHRMHYLQWLDQNSYETLSFMIRQVAEKFSIK